MGELSEEFATIRNWGDLVDCCLSTVCRFVKSNRLIWIEWSRVFGTPKRLYSVSCSSRCNTCCGTNQSSVWEDYIPISRFIWNWEQDNPVRRRSRNHEPAFEQVSYRFASTSFAELILSADTRNPNELDRIAHTLKIVGDAVAPFAVALHEKRDTKDKTEAISAILEQRYGLHKSDTLSCGELQLLNELATGKKIRAIARGANIRRDTVSRKLANAREKLGLGSNKELMSVLRPHQDA